VEPGPVRGDPGGGFGSPFTFTGELLDANDLLYLRARYYSPALGVFTALDPVENGNRYQYVGANPVNAADPTGMFAWGSSVTEQGDYCYCIGREAGIPDSHLENFAIWLKNNNPSDAFMPDTDSRKYWLYPGKPLNLPGSFAGIANIQGAGINKQGGCHCPRSVELGRCSAVINPVQNVNIDGCKCPEGMVWDPVRQWCGYPCPSGGVRAPGGPCPGFDWSVDFPPEPKAGDVYTPSGGVRTGNRCQDSTKALQNIAAMALFLSPLPIGKINPLGLIGVGDSLYPGINSFGIAVGGSLATKLGVGGGGSAVLMVDKNLENCGIFALGEFGLAFSVDAGITQLPALVTSTASVTEIPGPGDDISGDFGISLSASLSATCEVTVAVGISGTPLPSVSFTRSETGKISSCKEVWEFIKDVVEKTLS
jgi:RHS repeat-associated protein